MSIREGKKVAVIGQLKCPNGSTLYVRATVKDDLEALVATINLSDQGNGRFTGEFTMPDRPWAQATLNVFEDAGYTIPSVSFPCPITQVFQRDDSQDLSNANISVTICEPLKGFVSNTKLIGIAKLIKPLAGQLSKINGPGIIKEIKPIKGNINKTSIGGVAIKEC